MMGIRMIQCRLYESCGVDDAEMLDSDTSAQAAAVAQHQSDQPVLEQPVRVGAGYSDSIFNMLQQLENLSISNNDSSIASSCLGPHDGEDMDMSRSEEHAESYAEKNGGTDSTAAIAAADYYRDTQESIISLSLVSCVTSAVVSSVVREWNSIIYIGVNLNRETRAGPNAFFISVLNNDD